MGAKRETAVDGVVLALYMPKLRQFASVRRELRRYVEMSFQAVDQLSGLNIETVASD